MAGTRIDFRYVREQADFETVAAHYNLTLEGRGEQRKMLCPFHGDTKPSCGVNLTKKNFNCFGCGEHGNILDFVARMEDLDIRQAAMKLAEICGIETAPARGKRPASQRPEEDRAARPAKRRQVVEEPVGEPEKPNGAATSNKPLSFSLALSPEHPYLDERGITRDVIDFFGIGYCNKGIMKGRIAIPIHNEKGELIAYAGRWAETEPPKDVARWLLPKGFEKQYILFNLHRLPTGVDEIVLVESYWSVFRLHAHGVPVVSCMGRSVSAEQIGLLRATGATRVRILFDGDEAGRAGTAQVLPTLAQSFYAYAPEVPDGFKPHSGPADVLAELLDIKLYRF